MWIGYGVTGNGNLYDRIWLSRDGDMLNNSSRPRTVVWTHVSIQRSALL